MIRIFFIIIFMIPLTFLRFWICQIYLFILFFFFILKFSFNNLFIYIRYTIGIDLLRFTLILLTIWICGLIIMARYKILKTNYYKNLFLFIVLLLIISLFLTFSCLNIFMFYIFFEIRIIPTLILILGWGYQPERIQAGIYLLFYTLLGSLPLLICIFFYYKEFNVLDFYFFTGIDNLYVYLITIFVFLVKIPIFLVHLWLPKAHVEAPVSGSIILAGIMLKLGGYGLIRLIRIFKSLIFFNIYLIILSLLGRVLISLICLRQFDIKSLIAYSSVSHIALVLAGIITLNSWGLIGSLLIILAHGLCSSGLFCLANIIYENSGSRRFMINKGLINFAPRMSLWWFLFCSRNISAPLSINLFGEIILINRLITWRFYIIIFIVFILFFRGAYSLYLYRFTQHGKFYMGIYSFINGYVREFLLLILHWLPLNLLFVKMEFFFLFLYLNSLIKNINLWY